MVRRCTLFGLAAAALAEDVAVSSEPYSPPTSIEGSIFFEPFLDDWASRWTVSKDADFTGTWKHEEYAHNALEGDKGLVVGNQARKHAVSTLFDTPVDPNGKGLVVQYELQLKSGLECGGAYLKLLTSTDKLDAHGFVADTPYTIMFGPDKCGATNKVHFILRHKSPTTGEWEEKHLASAPAPITDKKTHLYTAVVGSDNTVKILVDNREVKTASFLSDEDFKPSVNPPKEIDDPADVKPEDWVDEAKMDDPEASKPEDWDEDAPAQIDDPKASKPDAWLDDAPLQVPDPNAVVPGDWDEEEDGEWEAPLVDNPDCKKAGCGEWLPPKIPNPDFKGKWYAPKVDNPAYKGVWSPAKIPNPNYYYDANPHAMAPIGGIGIELWTMQDGILFDNILISHDPEAASVAAKTYEARREKEDELVKRDVPDIERQPGFAGSVAYYAALALRFVKTNPIPVGLAICLGMLPLIFFCCCRSTNRYEAKVPAAKKESGPSSAAGSSGDAGAGSSSDPAPAADGSSGDEKTTKSKGKARARKVD